MQKISAIIPTFNEESNIVAAIESVKWADEIIVVDSFSTDNTLELAQKLGARILQNKFIDFATQKNWAIPQATHSWVFLLDADERVSVDLREEILQTTAHDEKHAAFWLDRSNQFMGKSIRFSGWQNDAVIRLFKRDSCRYNNKMVHEEITTSGSVGRLKYKLTHNTYKNLSDYLQKMDRYTSLSAKELVNKTQRVNIFHLLLKPLFRFVKHYFFKLGFLDGLEGFIISVMSAYSVFLKYLKVWRILRGESNV